MRRLANFLQRAPWLIVIARIFWRLIQPKFSAGAVGVVFNQEGHVLLVEHVFHPYAPWGLPGGWIDRNENPSETVRRELHEELNLTIEVGPVLLVEVDFGNHLDLAYLCFKTGNVGALSRELLDYTWCDPEQLPRLPSFHYRAIQAALKMNQTVEI
jgi:ADP-ribose pyrophosphatase YjhB (NUDIX family)